MEEREKQEIKDLVIAAVALGFVFAYPNIGLVPAMMLAVGVAFIVHELTHRYVARRMDCVAYYQLWVYGLLIAIVLAVATGGSIKFAAPGAVMIYPIARRRWGYQIDVMTPKSYGMIALSGPLSNLILGLIFYNLGPLFSVMYLAASVNVWLALFNLLPIPPLDGSKVMLWDIRIWIVSFAAALLALSFVTF